MEWLLKADKKSELKAKRRAEVILKNAKRRGSSLVLLRIFLFFSISSGILFYFYNFFLWVLWPDIPVATFRIRNEGKEWTSVQIQCWKWWLHSDSARGGLWWVLLHLHWTSVQKRHIAKQNHHTNLQVFSEYLNLISDPSVFWGNLHFFKHFPP